MKCVDNTTLGDCQFGGRVDYYKGSIRLWVLNLQAVGQIQPTIQHSEALQGSENMVVWQKLLLPCCQISGLVRSPTGKIAHWLSTWRWSRQGPAGGSEAQSCCVRLSGGSMWPRSGSTDCREVHGASFYSWRLREATWAPFLVVWSWAEVVQGPIQSMDRTPHHSSNPPH